MKVLKELKYLESHEWAKKEGSIFTCGITDYAQQELSDVVFVELPEIGKKVRKGEPLCIVESVKAASDIYAPLSGVIKEVNQILTQSPEIINTDPYGKGWLCKIEAAAPQEWELLLSSTDYERQITAV